MYAPGLDIDLIKSLDLDTTVHRTSINYMGCYAAINALKNAHYICQADSSANVLIVCLELCSLHFQQSQQTEELLATALFGDGAAAALVTAQNSSLSLEIESFYSDIIPDSEEEMAWTIGDFGFELQLSAYVPDILQKGLVQLQENLFEKGALQPQAIDQYALHPGGKRILEACEQQ
jgi:predicted naringenin-chalcone synthase